MLALVTRCTDGITPVCCPCYFVERGRFSPQNALKIGGVVFFTHGDHTKERGGEKNAK